MEPLSQDEIDEYFRYLNSDEPGEYDREERRRIAYAAVDSGLIDIILKALRDGIREGRPPRGGIIALWASAFQMGRECESRRAERAGKVAIQ